MSGSTPVSWQSQNYFRIIAQNENFFTNFLVHLRVKCSTCNGTRFDMESKMSLFSVCNECSVLYTYTYTNTDNFSVLMNILEDTFREKVSCQATDIYERYNCSNKLLMSLGIPLDIERICGIPNFPFICSVFKKKVETHFGL